MPSPERIGRRQASFRPLHLQGVPDVITISIVWVVFFFPVSLWVAYQVGYNRALDWVIEEFK